MLRLGRHCPRRGRARHVRRAVVLLYFRLRPYSRLQEQPPPGRAGGRSPGVGRHPALLGGLFVRRGTAAADPGAELPRFRGGDRLRRPRFRFLRGARAAETVVPPNRDDQDSPRSPLSHLAQDGAQRGHQVGALRVHGLHFDRCRPPDRPLAGIDGQGLYAGRDRCGLLRRGAQERLCELHDARLAHDALRRLDRPCRTPKPLPGNAPQHRVYEEHLFRLQGVQPSQHEYRRGRPLHAEGHDAR